MKRLLVALAFLASAAAAQADEPAKSKAKKQESPAAKALEKTGRNIWISPSDQERRRAATRKAAKNKDKN